MKATRIILSLVVIIFIGFASASCTSKPKKLSNIENIISNKKQASNQKERMITKMRKEKSMLNVAYVEVNDNSILNAGSFFLEKSGKPFFDIVIIFAANINWDSNEQKPYLHLNPNVKYQLENSETFIKPLQDKGIKVVLGLLPNHTGIGFSNMTTQDIEIFTDELVKTSKKYNLDGFDFDDEYANESKLSSRPINNESYPNLLKRSREKMPDKILTVFLFGGASRKDFYTGLVNPGDYIDGAWVNYVNGSSQTEAPQWLKQEQYAGNSLTFTNPHSIEISRSNAAADQNAGVGFTMFFNLGAGDYSQRFSAIAEEIYGDIVLHDGNFYHWDKKD